jgi:hypothetical protein
MLLLMLNVMALGNGVFSIAPKSDCDRAMSTAPAQHHVPAKQRCNLPWSPGCASAGICLPTMALIARPTAISVWLDRTLPATPVLRAPAIHEAAPDHPPPRI